MNNIKVGDLVTRIPAGNTSKELSPIFRDGFTGVVWSIETVEQGLHFKNYLRFKGYDHRGHIDCYKKLPLKNSD